MKNQDCTHHLWLEIDIDADPETHEAITGILFDLGCNGVVGHGEQPRCLKAYIEAGLASETQIELIKKRLNQITSNFPGSRVPVIKTRLIEEQDWSEKWKQFFRPERVTKNLTIIPVWKTPSRKPTGTIILMDPGPAFGTGQHPTTKMCLTALEEVKKPGSWNMLDVGTGSGILAIYGALLGARSVVAIDIDTEALRWAERNARLNEVQTRILFDTTPLKNIMEQFCVVVANLIYDTILELHKELTEVTEVGGFLILSGLLKEQVSSVVDRFQTMGMKPYGISHMEEWASVVFKKSASR